MRINITQPYADIRHGGLSGEHDLPDELARQLIAAGVAVAIAEPVKPTPAPKPKTPKAGGK